jgi:hypothetical protein
MSMKNHGRLKPTGKTPDSSTRPVWQSYQSHLIAKQEELATRMMNLSLRIIFVRTSNISLHAIKSFYMGPTALNPLQRKECCALLSPCAGFGSANVRFNGKHGNHYTTENDLPK